MIKMMSMITYCKIVYNTDISMEAKLIYLQGNRQVFAQKNDLLDMMGILCM